jgi:hypothetical protein
VLIGILWLSILIIILIFTLYRGYLEINYGRNISYIRGYIEDSDPNDFGVILGSLFIFPLYSYPGRSDILICQKFAEDIIAGY